MSHREEHLRKDRDDRLAALERSGAAPMDDALERGSADLMFFDRDGFGEGPDDGALFDAEPFGDDLHNPNAVLALDEIEARRRFRSLGEPDRRLLQILSLACMPLRADRLHRLLRKSELDRHTTDLTEVELEQRLSRLVDLGLLARQGHAFTSAVIIDQLALRELVASQQLAPVLQAVEEELRGLPARVSWRTLRSPQGAAALRREMRLAVYRGDARALQRTAGLADEWLDHRVSIKGVLVAELGRPLEREWIERLPSSLQRDAVGGILRSRLFQLEEVQPVVDLAWEQWGEQPERCDEWLRQRLAVALILSGELERAHRLVEPSDHGECMATVGLIELAQGRTDGALKIYAAGLKRLRAQQRWPGAFFSGIAGIFYVVALLARGRPKDLELALQACRAGRQSGELRACYRLLDDFVSICGDPTRVRRVQLLTDKTLLPDRPNLGNALLLWLEATVRQWTEEPSEPRLIDALSRIEARCRTAGLGWLSAQCTQALQHPQDPSEGRHGAPEQRFVELAGLLQPRPLWQRSLDALGAIARGGDAHQRRERRLAWSIELQDGVIAVQPREQRRQANGGFTKGRALATTHLERLPAELDYLSEQDVRLCVHLERELDDDRGKVVEVVGAAAARALIGHPRVCWRDRPERLVEVVAGRPELRVERLVDGGARIRLEPRMVDGAEYIAERDGDDRVRVIEFGERQQRIARLLGPGLVVPASAEPRVIEALSATASFVDVRSEIDTELDTVESIAAGPGVRARLAVRDRGLEVELVCQPLGEGGPVFPPGQGPVVVVATVDGKRRQTRRDLEAERERWQRVVDACPAFGEAVPPASRWVVADPGQSLELLVQLRAVGEELPLVWRGEREIKVRSEVGTGQLRLRIGSGKDWFKLGGELRVDEGLVIDMLRLLELTSSLSGRFVPLEDGGYLALSQALMNQLDALRSYTQRRGRGLHFHPLAAGVLDEVAREAGEVEETQHFRERVAELERLFRAQPDLPTSLRAELRGYQVEGFTWLVRLASGAMGACLADDMGLGKTVQVLTLLLSRAALGPSLVIAPTSVCGDWCAQAARFAPGLHLVELGADDRARTLGGLGPGDVLLCSYAMLLREAASLAELELNVVVLDEAQAIKNPSTKRWRAATGLRAQARVITTGTPVENHLDELWALFQFLNPGLLGGRRAFTRGFALPIERDKDRTRLAHLKALIAPFILRRTKPQVLTELPPRTEITLEVELGANERAHYEALRQSALSRLAEADGGPPGHVRILAEITKLRRACGNPVLVTPQSDLRSDKLDAGENLLLRLRQGGHRILVFSQWVDQLKAMRARLQRSEVSVLYLDGATPERQRREHIAAFQQGEGEVFLISLKAGGQGINLTAASYVVHLDPWWNPAVEDQASDRAHRIGQRQAVTVYRLIVKDSIEEQIVAMHREKRDLASQLLAGGEMAARLSADELLALIREGGRSG